MVLMVVLLSCSQVMTSCSLEVDSSDPHMCGETHPGCVGIGLSIVNNEPKPLDLVSGGRYYIDSIALKANRWGAPTDDFAQWVKEDSFLSGLDWEDNVLARSTGGRTMPSRDLPASPRRASIRKPHGRGRHIRSR